MACKSNSKEGKHFVLVHGANHGAWCWYKLKPLLQRAGHRVDALDMAASGIHPKTIYEVNTLKEYYEPLINLIESLPDDERVIVVGHSQGGLGLTLVMDMFPNKIEVAIFLAAFMPDTDHPPSYVFEQHDARNPDALDIEFKNHGNPEDIRQTMLFGPQYLSLLYHLSPVEDLELGMMLTRPSSVFFHDQRMQEKFSKERHESIRRVYIICDEDKGVPKYFQIWMAENGGVKEIKELKGADHMPMFSVPQKLGDCLVEIVQDCIKH